MIAVGQLDTFITLQKPTFTANANYGGIQNVSAWENPVEISGVWAHRVWRGGAERDEAEESEGNPRFCYG